ncbi:hypothetical protein RJ55_04150 [Drechmeria coniospora]|nr:hypothetical protein RJ55_04150 [Drechmeria coniospora]
MPLIVVTGLPTSGKSTRAKQLCEYVSQRIADSPKHQNHRLHLISDDSLSIDRSVYHLSPEAVPAHTRSANASEKDARAALYAAVKRVLSDNDFVILDGLNYIKGWRYQLHCEAKAMRTPNCILQIGCSVDRARAVNEERLRKRRRQQEPSGADAREGDVIPEGDATEPYEPANWDNLVFRYEEPNPMTRWDSPLFTLIWDDNQDQTRKTFDSLWDVMAGDGKPVVRPNQSTERRGRDAGSDYLYVLDRETQDIIKRILERQAVDGGGHGGQVPIPLTAKDAQELAVHLPVGKQLALPQLQRLRRAFVGLNRGGIGLDSVGNMAADGLRETFVRYLNDAFEEDA